MEVIASLGRGVDDTVQPTYEIYGNILRQPANTNTIHSTKVTSYQYGPHERQKLDVYEPSSTAPPAPADKERPILVYVYGGAFLFGDRVLQEIPGGVVYKNIGSFFADKLGYIVVVIDYRLIKHGAKYPSGGEDLDTALRWIWNHFYGRRDVFLMGHSAGGSHVATWLFDQRFQHNRGQLSEDPTGLMLQGVIFLSTPLTVTPDLEPLFQPYYGDAPASRKIQPTALMKEIVQTNNTRNLPKLLILLAELDPEPVFYAAEDFKGSWQQPDDEIKVEVLKGHNHHSPPISLGTNIETEEAWGLMVGEWMKTVAVGS